MGLLEKRLWKFDNIHVLLRMRQKVWKLWNVFPNNLYKLHFWDNLYKLHPWLSSPDDVTNKWVWPLTWVSCINGTSVYQTYLQLISYRNDFII